MVHAAVIKAVIFASIIVGGATYFAETAQPMKAGLIATIPVALPAIWFMTIDVNDRGKLEDYAWTFMLGIASYFLAAVTFYYLFVHRRFDKKKAIGCSMAVWLGLVILSYFFLSTRKLH